MDVDEFTKLWWPGNQQKMTIKVLTPAKLQTEIRSIDGRHQLDDVHGCESDKKVGSFFHRKSSSTGGFKRKRRLQPNWSLFCLVRVQVVRLRLKVVS